MKTAIAKRTFRRTDNNQIVLIGKQIEGADAYIDELARNRIVRNVKLSTQQTNEVPFVPPPVVKVEADMVVTTSENPTPRTRKKTKKYADWNHQSSE